MPKLNVKQRFFFLRTWKYEKIATVFSLCAELPPSYSVIYDLNEKFCETVSVEGGLKKKTKDHVEVIKHVS
jgi:hypothetical protein